MPEFTKGTWGVVKNKTACDLLGLFEISAPGEPYWIAQVGTSCTNYNIAEANAKLMAASKDMYEALKFVFEILDQNVEEVYTWTEGHALMNKIEVALTKAEKGDQT